MEGELTELRVPFTQQLPDESSNYAFDGGVSDLIVGVNCNERRAETSLDIFDLCSEGRRQSLRCRWDNKLVFRDLMYDNDGQSAHCVLRGRNSEVIFRHDPRLQIPSAKKLLRESLKFRQNSAVQIKRVGLYSNLAVTHCQDGTCSLWDMRWTDRAAVEYANIAAGKPNLPICVDRSAQFVTVTDGDLVTRIFNLKTGLNLYTEKNIMDDGDTANNVFSFYDNCGLDSRPTLFSNIATGNIQAQFLNFD